MALLKERINILRLSEQSKRTANRWCGARTAPTCTGRSARSAAFCPANLTNFAAGVNERTVLTMSEKYLGLIGPEDSIYLRLIQREAEKALEGKRDD